MYFASRNQKMRDPFNPNDPVKSLYKRPNECIYYATLTGKSIT